MILTKEQIKALAFIGIAIVIGLLLLYLKKINVNFIENPYLKEEKQFFKSEINKNRNNN